MKYKRSNDVRTATPKRAPPTAVRAIFGVVSRAVGHRKVKKSVLPYHMYYQGRIEPPKAARGHATSYSARTDGIVLSVTQNNVTS